MNRITSNDWSKLAPALDLHVASLPDTKTFLHFRDNKATLAYVSGDARLEYSVECLCENETTASVSTQTFRPLKIALRKGPLSVATSDSTVLLNRKGAPAIVLRKGVSHVATRVSPAMTVNGGLLSRGLRACSTGSMTHWDYVLIDMVWAPKGLIDIYGESPFEKNMATIPCEGCTQVTGEQVVIDTSMASLFGRLCGPLSEDVVIRISRDVVQLTCGDNLFLQTPRHRDYCLFWPDETTPTLRPYKVKDLRDILDKHEDFLIPIICDPVIETFQSGISAPLMASMWLDRTIQGKARNKSVLFGYGDEAFFVREHVRGMDITYASKEAKRGYRKRIF